MTVAPMNNLAALLQALQSEPRREIYRQQRNGEWAAFRAADLLGMGALAIDHGALGLG